jgi:CO/xanthine dehydrogenase Mo-binding subunit
MTEILSKDLSRTTFLKGGAMIVGFCGAGALIGAGRADPAGIVPYASAGPPANNAVDSWLRINADNTATIDYGHIELGQGSSAGMAMIAAEELDLDLSQIRLARVDTNASPRAGGSTNSLTISNNGRQLRAAAAHARQALLALASAQLGVPVSSLTVSKGVVSGAGRAIAYGSLVGGKLLNVTMPRTTGRVSIYEDRDGLTETLGAGEAPAKAVSQYKIVGTRQPRFDVPDKISGKFTFVQNVRVPGMLHARIVRPRGQAAYPTGAPIVSVDEGSIKSTGAAVVRKGDLIAVVAPQEYQAIQAAAQLKVEWADSPKIASSGNIFGQMREFDARGETPAAINVDQGNVAAGFASAALTLSQSYRFHYHGHLPIGPSCAVADVTRNGAVIFSNTQDVYSLRTLVAGVTGLPTNNVRVVYYEGSSCYGGSPYDDVALSAAAVSQLVGKPVRLQFMRWDEHGWDNLGPLMMFDIKAGLDREGKIVAHELTAFTQRGTALADTTRLLLGEQAPVAGAANARIRSDGTQILDQYHLPNRRIITKSLPAVNTYFKARFLRGVNATPSAFAAEQFMDELAYAAKLDPVEFRLRNHGVGTGPGVDKNDRGRARDALEATAILANWKPRVAASARPSGTVVKGRGVAHGGYGGSWAPVIADVEVNTKTGKITVTDLWSVEQAGLAVNPEGIENQMVGQLTTGTGRALVEQVRFNTKRVTSLDWASYQTLRFTDAPRVHVAVLQRSDLQPTGSGEPAYVPVAPAIANAFFDATGVRIREVPMSPARVRAVLAAAGR